MNFGVVMFPTEYSIAPGDLGRALEERRFESVWFPEHTHIPVSRRSPWPGGGDLPKEYWSAYDPFLALTAAAMTTSRLRLGTGICLVVERDPIVTAKEVATLDRLSGGRVELGVGVGWLEEEFDAIGVPFSDRGKRTDDHVAALRALWSGDPATHHGEFSAFDKVYSRPRPTQANIPIVVGGHSKAAARRAGRLGDGFFPGRGSHEELAELIDVVRTTAVEHGRDPDAIEITTGGNGALGSGALDEIKKLADLGVSRVIIPPLAFDVEGQREGFARYGEEVIARC